MKKHLAILGVIMILFTMSSCRKNGYYDRGYQEGYDAGYIDGSTDTRLKMEDDSNIGYAYGNSEGYWEGYNDAKSEYTQEIIEEAEDYARDQTGWSVYEAWNSICIYHAGVDPNGLSLPTEEEYRQCVETLVYFCEYLDRVN